MRGFVAIDFEHLYPAHETACEVGAVRVVDGLVTGRYYSTISFSFEYCKGKSNSDIIGLTYDNLINSPKFSDVFSQLQAFIGNFPLVVHHGSTELSVLNKCCNLNEITALLGNGDIFDTFDKTKKSLIESCRMYDIPFMNHHDPLADAEATAKLFLRLIGQEQINIVRGNRKTNLSFYLKEKETFDNSVLQPLSDEEVRCKDTPFFGSTRTVVSGLFPHFPDRNALKAALKELGADINENVSSITQIFVVGETNVGPTKMEKAKKYGTRIMREEELMKYIFPQI